MYDSHSVLDHNVVDFKHVLHGHYHDLLQGIVNYYIHSFVFDYYLHAFLSFSPCFVIYNVAPASCFQRDLWLFWAFNTFTFHEPQFGFLVYLQTFVSFSFVSASKLRDSKFFAVVNVTACNFISQEEYCQFKGITAKVVL